MAVDKLIGKVHKRLEGKEFSSIEKLAIQVNLSGRILGVFYIEILQGVVSIMPYEYRDRDAFITLSMTNFNTLMAGRLNLEEAIDTGKLKVEGDMDKLLQLIGLFKS